MPSGAVFLDRDGIINWRIVGDYVRSPEEFHFLPDIFPFLLGIRHLGLLAIVVTNQQGVAKGLMSLEQLQQVHDHMQQQLIRRIGSGVDDILVCTDPAESNSWYRKPQPGMLVEALRRWQLPPAACWMVGDSATDILAGRRAGVRTIFVGHFPLPEADFCVLNLKEALEIIATHQTAADVRQRLQH